MEERRGGRVRFVYIGPERMGGLSLWTICCL